MLIGFLFFFKSISLLQTNNYLKQMFNYAFAIQSNANVISKLISNLSPGSTFEHIVNASIQR